MKRIMLVAAAVLSLSCGCEKKPSVPEGPTKEDNTAEDVAHIYTTTADGTLLFSSREVSFLKIPEVNQKNIIISKAKTYQTIDGFGAAITGSTAYNLLQMTKENRTAFLKEVFDPESGLGSSLIRVSIGASDFSLGEYTWCDKAGLENFGIHSYDMQHLIPVLHEIYTINPDVKIVASPWSAPLWMKRAPYSEADHNKWTDGRLKTSCYEDYAMYFVKWIQTMENEGFKIHAMTIQNEPLNRGNSMSMYMSWQEQLAFVKTALGPAFEKNGIKTKILVFDHNYNYDNISDQRGYPLNIYADADAAQYISGSAWHNYGGDVAEMLNVATKAPSKEIYFTEASIGTWNYNFASCLINDFRDIFMKTLGYGNKGVTLWNLMLDDKKGPNRPGGCQTCYGAVTLSSSTHTVISRQSHYYNIAHASKVIRPGAVRLSTSGYTQSGLSYHVFLNPDGTYGVIALNEGEAVVVVFKDGNHSVKCEIPSKSIVSLSWNS